MFWDSWFKKEDDNTTLSFFKNILFPPLERKVQDGAEFFVDYSIDSNLEAIICDIQDGSADGITIQNLNYVIDRLHLIRKRYRIYPEIKSKSATTYYMVSSANRD
jgi:hypothetical protein